MTEHVPSDLTAEPPTAIDIATLRERDDVSFAEQTHTYADTDHCEAAAAGRVVVGVTDDAGRVLLLVHDDGPHALLPNQPVDADDDWRALARKTAADVAGAPITLTGVERLRRVEHVTEGDERPHNVTHHVVFGATAEDAEPGPGPDGWTAGWHTELPVPAERGSGAVADIEHFLQ